MNTTPLKNYAPQARKDFIAAVTTQAARLGITAKETAPATVEGDVLLVKGQAFPKTVQGGRDKLITQVKADGFNQVMDRISYTWFNRFVAIRYMELHNYLGHGYRVLSDPQGSGRPEILDHAADVDLPGLDRAKVVELKLDGTKDEELYRLLLKAQCNALNKAMPFLFEPIGHETELLLPANLLQTDSLIRKLVESIEEEAWEQIEIIGWLYQFYISEKKDQVIGKVVKSEDIPAATQLFTPNWIVKYMVQNSLGAQWLATYPHSPLRDGLEYYIEPADQTDEVKAQLAAITPDSLNPEEITLIDPACGSGHILVEAYDLFKAIYLERGYRERDAAKLILTKNLYGLDIDQRAAQLSGFALMMKGRADDRRLFERDIKLNVMAMVNSDQLDIGYLAHPIKNNKTGLEESDLRELKKLFEHATTFGSLIQVPEHLAKKLPALRELCDHEEGYLYVEKALESLEPLVRRAEILAGRYDCVVANPPYMGSKYQLSLLKKFLGANYDGYEKDLFSAFIARSLELSNSAGRLGFMSPFVWMFIKSHLSLRSRIIELETLLSLIQLEYSGFDGATVPICTFVLQKARVLERKGCYIKLSAFKGAANQGPKTREAIKNRECGWFFEAVQDDFTRIPGSPIAYWVGSAFFDAFQRYESLGSVYPSKSGLSTTDNDRFLRFWQEVSAARIGEDVNDVSETKGACHFWYPIAKGGAYRKWYGNNNYVVNWRDDGRDIKEKTRGAAGGRIVSPEFYFKPGVTWSGISSSLPSMRIMKNSIFGSGAKAVFAGKRNLSLLGLLNSCVATDSLKILSPTLNFEAGHIGSLPILPNQQLAPAETVVSSIVELSQKDWDVYENSWNFEFPPVLALESENLETAFATWVEQNGKLISRLKLLEEENNRFFIEAYGLEEELTPDVPIEQITLTVNPAYRYGVKGTEEERQTRFREDTMQELVSYAVGCIMGRYSLDEPGLIYAHSGNEGFDPSRYSKFPADEDGIIPLLDTAWFEDDAANRLVEFISVAWDGAHLEENLTFLADNLSPNKKESARDTIRRYLCDKFFKDHLQTYKNRPIYWLFSSGKQKAFQCLVYLHRYNEGTLARMRSEYVIPLQGKIAARLEHLKADLATASSSAQTKRLTKESDKLKKQQAELLKFDEKLRHYADRRISLDLDDGVKVNYGKFGSLLAEAKKVHGQKPEGP